MLAVAGLALLRPRAGGPGSEGTDRPPAARPVAPRESAGEAPGRVPPSRPAGAPKETRAEVPPAQAGQGTGSASAFRWRPPDEGLRTAVAESAPGILDLTASVSDYGLMPLGGGRWRVTAGGAFALSVKGRPALPFVRREVLLEEDTSPSLEVVSAAWESVSCPPLADSPGFVSRADGPTETPGRRAAELTTPGPFPETPAWATEPYTLRGLRGVGVVLCPFSYDAESRTLRVCRDLRVRVRGAARVSYLQKLPAGSLIWGARRWPEQVLPLLRVKSAPAAQDSLLVLAPEALVDAPALQSFLSWKWQRGVAATVRGLPPQTTAAAVAALIRDFASRTERPNVLLLGSETAIPPAQASSPPSDTVYAMLDGPGDRYHDLAVARLTVSSADDLALQLGRAERYERWQWTGPAPGPWCAAATAIASDENQGNLGLLDREAMEIARTQLLTYGYHPCDALYETDQSSPDKGMLADGWNAGRGLILYLGHGLQQNWRTTGFSGSDVALLLRYGPSLPFVLSAACHTGNFTLASDCLCESLVKGGVPDAPTGAVAVVGSTSTMDWDPPVVMLHSFVAYLTRQPAFTAGGLQFTGEPPRTMAGEFVFDAVQRAVDFCLATPGEGDEAARKIAHQTHLFGDPTLGVRTRPPVPLEVSHADTAPLGTGLQVQVREAGTRAPLAGVSVCLSAPGVQWLAATDASGNALIPIPQEGPVGEMVLTAYAPDAVPLQSAVTVISPAAPVRILTTVLPVGRRGAPYEAALEAEGGSGSGYSWSALGTLPAGMTLAGDGVLSGIPEEFGQWRVAVRVQDSAWPALSAETELSLRIESPAYVAARALPDAESCRLYAAAVPAAGSWPPVVFSVPDPEDPGNAGLPSFPWWLSLAPDGSLSGTPPAPALVQVPVRVSDAAGNECTAVLPLSVAPARPDRDGDADVSTPELLEFRGLVLAGCAQGEDWLAALAHWQGVRGGATPPAPEPSGTPFLAPRRALGSSRYLPGAQETILIELGAAREPPAGAVAVLTEVLPDGWQLAPAGARDATGRLLPWLRRDGQAFSWVLDESTIRQGEVRITVIPGLPDADPAPLLGWVTLPDGTERTGGTQSWGVRPRQGFRLTLEAGWNLVAFPVEIPPADIPPLLATLGLWSCASPPGKRDPAAGVRALEAFWVWAPAPAVLEGNGFEPADPLPRTGPGWTPCGVGRTTSPAELDPPPRAVWQWGPLGWQPVGGELEPGRGYLILAE